MPLFLFIFHIVYNIYSFNHIYTIHVSVAIRWGLSLMSFNVQQEKFTLRTVYVSDTIICRKYVSEGVFSTKRHKIHE